MEKSFDKEYSAFRERYISPKSIGQSTHSPHLSSYGPDFRLTTSPSPMKESRTSSILDDRHKSNSKAVANCIRSLTERITALENENQSNKKQQTIDREKSQKEKDDLISRFEEEQKV